MKRVTRVIVTGWISDPYIRTDKVTKEKGNLERKIFIKLLKISVFIVY